MVLFSGTGLPDLANKNTEHLVKYAFQVVIFKCKDIPGIALGTRTLSVVCLKFVFNWAPGFRLTSRPRASFVHGHYGGIQGGHWRVCSWSLDGFQSPFSAEIALEIRVVSF